MTSMVNSVLRRQHPWPNHDDIHALICMALPLIRIAAVFNYTVDELPLCICGENDVCRSAFVVSELPRLSPHANHAFGTLCVPCFVRTNVASAHNS